MIYSPLRIAICPPDRSSRKEKIVSERAEGSRRCGNGESSSLANPQPEFRPPSPVQATEARMISIWR